MAVQSLSLRIGAILRNFNKATWARNAMVCAAAFAPHVLTGPRDDNDDDNRPVLIVDVEEEVNVREMLERCAI